MKTTCARLWALAASLGALLCTLPAARAEEVEAYVARLAQTCLSYDQSLTWRPTVLRVAVLYDPRRSHARDDAAGLQDALRARFINGLGEQRRTVLVELVPFTTDILALRTALLQKDYLAMTLPAGLGDAELATLRPVSEEGRIRTLDYPAVGFRAGVAIGIPEARGVPEVVPYIDEEWLFRTGGPFDSAGLANAHVKRLTPEERQNLAAHYPAPPPQAGVVPQPPPPVSERIR